MSEKQTDSVEQVPLSYSRSQLGRSTIAAPHSAEQTKRLDELHYMFRCYLGANIIAPIHEPLAVLDVGTGSGRWAIEAATEYPTAEVIGLDIVAITSPNFPTPKNCRFVVGDLTKGLYEFADASYDLVHSR